MKSRVVPLIVLLFALLHSVFSRADERSPLISNGNFESASAGAPADWGLAPGVTWEADGTNHFLRLRTSDPAAQIMVYRAIALPADVKALRFSFRVRYQNVQPGKENWFDARIMMNFKDATGKTLEPGPPHPSFKGTNTAWADQSEQFRVPVGATKLELMPTLFHAASGQIDFDDFALTPIDPKVIDAADSDARVREVARIAALPRPARQVPVPSVDKLPKELRVVGNHLQTSTGRLVWLQGVAIPSLEWSAGGEHVLESIGVAITDWKANCIRLPVRENFWAGAGPWQSDGGAGYRQLIDDCVNLSAAHGAYLVIDLHDFRAPTEQHAAFWKDVARVYKNHPAVIFELFNEPHDISWDIWRNGGIVTDKTAGSGAVAENQQKLTSFTAVGMQKLVEVIRQEKARNLIVAGGLDWGYDLSGILTGSALTDHDGNGIVYSSHVYPWKGDWQHKFLDTAAKYPLFIGEVGADEKKLDFIPAAAQEDPATWAPDMLGTIQQNHLNWTAWCFHPTSSPRLLLDWKFTPTPFWGEPVKRALAGEKFESKKLR